MQSYAGYPQAMAPPVRPKKGPPVIPVLLALAAVGAAVFVYLRYFRKAASATTATVTASQADTISQATNGSPAVSAAAGGALLAAPVPSATTVLVQTPAQAVAAAAASPSATTSAASSTASGSGPALTAYKNTTAPGPAGSGLCLSEGGPNGSAALYWCFKGASQQWLYDATAGSLKGGSSGNCLAASSPAAGSAVISKTCDSGDANQSWNWTGSGFGLKGSGQCMDSTALSNGATMALNPCSGGASQTYVQG